MHIRTAITVFVFSTLTLNAQTSNPGTIAEKSLVIARDSSASVLGWFRMLESKGVILSYNSSHINLQEQITVSKQTLSVEELLNLLLYRYDFELSYINDKKILIQIRGKRIVSLWGKITDSETQEGLDACIIGFKDVSGKLFSTLTDDAGKFRIKLPVGHYTLITSHIGFKPYNKQLLITKNHSLAIELSQIAFPINEVEVKASPFSDEINMKGARNRLSLNGDDPFAQLYSMPGITGSTVGGNLHVNGGQNDENLILMDGIPFYHSHHNNSLLSQFNGDAVQKVAFYGSFIPAQYEGRLSSVTDVKIKDGDLNHHHQAISIDMPASSVTFDGPIVRNKLTYMISGRHSWLDFMEDLLSDRQKMNRSFWDITAKLRYKISRQTSLEALVYQSKDLFKDSTNYSGNNQEVLKWKSSVYSLVFKTKVADKIKMSNTLAFSDYQTKMFAPTIGIEVPFNIHEGMNKWIFKSDYALHSDQYVDAAWGIKLARERFNLLASKDTVENNRRFITQTAAYVNTKIQLSDKVDGSVALNLVGYLPKHNRKYFSLQPRFTLRYIPNHKNLWSLDFSRMQQFYHTICLDATPLPSDFRMPSINGFEPSSSIHFELGWKYMEKNWRYTLSSFYKKRYHILGVRYTLAPYEEDWHRFITKGNAESYGIKVHTQGIWNKWMLDLAYTYSRSYESFKEYKDNKKVPTLHDFPHIFNYALSYHVKKNSFLTLGGYVRSGMLTTVFNEDLSSIVLIDGRKRGEMNYRLDFNFSSAIHSKSKKVNFSYKIGLYNIIGNPQEEEIIDLYSIETKKHCLPYFSLRLKL